ncbi:MAG: MBL fold metallo-hydrolase [Eubacteriales bacterium]
MEFAVKYHEHSGFSIKVDDIFFLFDYYKGDLPTEDIEKAKIPFVFVSHGHKDHYNKAIFSLKEHNKNLVYVLSNGVQVNEEVVYVLPNQKLIIKGVTIETFESTDEGVCFLITYRGVKIFHAGDLNLWSWRDDSTDEEIKLATKNYYKVINAILRATPQIDIAFFPVDPRMKKNYEEGAVKFIEALKVLHFFPMHMWGKYKASNVLDKYDFKNTIIYKVNNDNKEFKIYIGVKNL